MAAAADGAAAKSTRARMGAAAPVSMARFERHDTIDFTQQGAILAQQMSSKRQGIGREIGREREDGRRGAPRGGEL